ncbi:hypothetical protein Pcinc_038324 [Petrolisthes cinctipes]|uniref:Uncharacterized protein n=1 Tax=Petrolisthes cinctipes TaxID=88211 RepID=A0AAE1BTW9_PETCI|nr:hypothetical protein Pcinc_038324 [Petrolisthes cinctipes]
MSRNDNHTKTAATSDIHHPSPTHRNYIIKILQYISTNDPHQPAAFGQATIGQPQYITNTYSDSKQPRKQSRTISL